jgi:hypothetical protein
MPDDKVMGARGLRLRRLFHEIATLAFTAPRFFLLVRKHM